MALLQRGSQGNRRFSSRTGDFVDNQPLVVPRLAAAYPDGRPRLGNHSMVAVVEGWAHTPQRNFALARSFHCGVIDEGTGSTRVRGCPEAGCRGEAAAGQQRHTRGTRALIGNPAVPEAEARQRRSAGLCGARGYLPPPQPWNGCLTAAHHSSNHDWLNRSNFSPLSMERYSSKKSCTLWCSFWFIM